MGKSTFVFGAMVIEPGMMKSTAAPAVTVAFAVASAMPGKLARITLDPAATPVTGTLALKAPVTMVTVAGTMAAAVLEEFRVNVRPGAGAAADSVRVKFCVAVPVIVMEAGLRLIEAVTVTLFEPVE